MRNVSKLLGAGAVVAALAASAPAAFASGPPTGNYAPFAQCPVSVKGVANCVVSTTSSGTFKLGSETVPVNAPIIFQGGYKINNKTGAETFVGAANGQTLDASPLQVPGGLLGLTDPTSLPQPLQTIVDNAINAFNGVTATAELVGQPTFSFANFLNQTGPAVTLPIQVQLSNPFLGSSCYIGSASDPVTLNLTSGTTTPPAGVAPLTGSLGTLGSTNNGNILVSSGGSLVDNTFAVPGASGCGGAFSALIDEVVDLKAGVPAAAGVSEAVLNGTSEIAGASAVKRNEHASKG